MLPRVRGHREALALLGRAAVAGDLAQSVLLHGAAGIGKERVGLWVAQLLVCDAPADGAPCDACRPCRLTLRLEHPDVHWFFPLSRPDASSPEKLREKLEEQRAAELAARRQTPHHRPAHERPPAHFVGAVQSIQRLAAVRPAMGKRKVFVIGDAEMMVPQESSPEAANAFLKLLEEPPADTVLILTSSQPGALLPTIRSRVLPLRLSPLADEDVRDYLVGEAGVEPGEAQTIAAAARGAVGRALRLAPSVDGSGSYAEHQESGRKMLLAVLSSSPVPRLALAHDRAPSGARGDFLAELEALSDWLRDLLAAASGAAAAVRDPDARTLVERALKQHPTAALAVGRALDQVARAREMAQGNVNPQLILADLLRRVQAELRPESTRGAAAAGS
jgi:DNA polymerase-3 subunit delta'